MPIRRTTRSVTIGTLPIGSSHPISVQSMLKTGLDDIDAAVKQLKSLEQAGCELIRVATPTPKSTDIIPILKQHTNMPIVADIHFNYTIALKAIKHNADGIRLNPGNIKEKSQVEAVLRLAKERGVAIRIGLNSGSILAQKDAPETLKDVMMEECLRYIDWFEKNHFHDSILSLKTSDVVTTIEVNRIIAQKTDYPLHLGVTATGPYESSVIKSSIGIGTLLAEGIGDTIRVSMTAPPEEEVRVGYQILEALHLRTLLHPKIISCPTCGRCQIDLRRIVREVETRTRTLANDITIAIMGCVVNGPGEARHADVGIAGGKGFGFLFRNGKKIRKVPEDALLNALMDEIERMTEK